MVWLHILMGTLGLVSGWVAIGAGKGRTLHIAAGQAFVGSMLTMAATADALLRQRALVLSRLRALGVDVIEAPHDRIGTRLIDAYLAIKRKGAIG